nr:hypothetical protein [Tanacetum cinerariifolium]
QPIPIGRPYHTQPNGVRKMLTARKRVRAPPVGRLASRYPPDHSSLNHFSSDDSSSDLLSGYSSYTSSCHSIPDSHFDTLAAISARPSHKRCRSSTTSASIARPVSGALSLIRADLLPPRKRIRGSADIDTGIAAVDAAAAKETDVRVEVGIEAETKAGEEANAKIQIEGTIEIEVDVATEIDILDDLLTPDAVERLWQLEEGMQGVYDHMQEIPLQRIDDIESRQIEQKGRNLIVDGERSGLLKRVMALEGSNTRLRDA